MSKADVDPFGCRVVTREEIWLGGPRPASAGLEEACGGAGLLRSLTRVWELNGNSSVGVATAAPCEAKDANGLSSTKMAPSEAGMAPAVVLWECNRRLDTCNFIH